MFLAIKYLLYTVAHSRLYILFRAEFVGCTWVKTTDWHRLKKYQAHCISLRVLGAASRERILNYTRGRKSDTPLIVCPCRLCCCSLGAKWGQAQACSACWICVCSVQLFIFYYDYKEVERLLRFLSRCSPPCILLQYIVQDILNHCLEQLDWIFFLFLNFFIFYYNIYCDINKTKH